MGGTSGGICVPTTAQARCPVAWGLPEQVVCAPADRQRPIRGPEQT
jgi:hypothetical protein